MKYVFITGGVTSSLGKGVTAAALGCLLKARGYSVSLQKLDLYYNAEPGFLSPMEHGEAFITDDGYATDLDLGNYERFVDVTLKGSACCTTGKIHRRLLERELHGEFHGSTIQAIPHVTNEIKQNIRDVALDSGADICIVEIGGTVGDMEASVYLEAIRQMRLECDSPNDCCYVHLTFMPYISTAGELKTKPTQNSVKVLRSVGIQPDVIVCRTEVAMSGEAKDKIALFCNVKTSNVIQNLDLDMLYDLPIVLEKEGLARAVAIELHLSDAAPNLEQWRAFTKRAREAKTPLKVALVGKYNAVPDAYLSVTEALKHAGIENGVRVVIDPIQAEELTEDTVQDLLGKHRAIIVPGGFGDRGTDGMMVAATFARENQIPFLAIGFGMQLAVVEAARNLLGIADAHTTEADPDTTHSVVRIPEDRICQNDSRSATRMGHSGVKLMEGLVRDVYGKDVIEERHSNRYEVDPDYVQALADKGFCMVGTSMEAGYPEVFELKNHPFYVAVIYHPEYLSRPGKPHPLFCALVKAAETRR
ncbi:MAG: CTP synthase [Clostridia bacterium]